MKRIPLTQGQFAMVDDEDYRSITKYKWHLKVGASGIKYAVRRVIINGKRAIVRMHRVILNTPKGFQTDHRNGNGLDNRRTNLRVCSAIQNQQNSHCTSGVSQYKGVYKDATAKARPWRSQINIAKKRFYLGHFESEIRAALAYDEVARKHFGEFARLNFPLNTGVE